MLKTTLRRWFCCPMVRLVLLSLVLGLRVLLSLGLGLRLLLPRGAASSSLRTLFASRAGP